MSGFTSEDFAQATLATRGDYGVARRADPTETDPWHIYGDGQGWFSDDEMAADGWTPVVESRITEHTLRHVEERAERKRRKLLDHIASLEAIISRRNETIERMTAQAVKREGEIKALRVARDELRTIVDGLHAEIREMAARPLTLDDLVDAWEAAEVPTDGAPIRSGDVVIEKISAGAYAVMSPPPTCGLVGREFRVLSRAPREPWQDLADVLGGFAIHDHDGKEYPDVLAQKLHERGVRMTGGEES